MAEEPYYHSARKFVPARPSLAKLKTAAMGCTACHLWEHATQTVFGEGSANAKIMLVGEQPGDVEDSKGKPFVGPAGKLLDKALAEAGINPESVYTTNAVKHFKWVPKGGRRIHSKPNRYEIEACHPWLEAEIAALKPGIIVCLGATAAQALLGKDFKVTQRRGEFISSDGMTYFATVHPSAILRAPDASRAEERARFVEDLRKVSSRL